MDQAQRLKGLGGNMPYRTGRLRGSLVTQLNGTTSAAAVNSYKAFAPRIQPGSDLRVAWTAPYALAREFGSRNNPPDFFMRGAVQMWPSIVQSEARKWQI